LTNISEKRFSEKYFKHKKGFFSRRFRPKWFKADS